MSGKEFPKKFRPSDLTIIFAVQRESIDAWVKRLAREFKERGVGVVYVSKRDDGTLVVVDGQHRILALRALGIDTPIHCHVYTGLTRAEECDLFLVLNNRRNVKATDKFRLGVGAGLADCVAVDGMLRERGLAITGDPSANGHAQISCASALLGEYNRAERERTGEQALGLALDAIIAAWGTNGAALEGHIVSGLSQLYHANAWIKNDDLTARLAKFPSGAAGVIGRARGRYEYERGSLSKCVAKVVADEYNRRRPKNRLAYP